MSSGGQNEFREGLREELASVAASLRAYLEWQQDTGATGIPRRPRGAAPVPIPGPGPAPVPETGSNAARPSPPSPPLTHPAAAPPMPAPAPDPEPMPVSARHAPIDPAFAQAPPPPPAPVAAPAPAAAPVSVRAPVVTGPPRPLPVIAAEVVSCTKCELAKTRTNTVFSRGNPEAKLCFVGEAPGADEDAQGIPFVGRAGQLLDRMIQAMGLDPEKDVYVCNIIKCRPPGNRKPEPEETDACIPYLHEQIAVVDPKVIVALGNTAVGTLLNTKLGITKVRGSWKLYRGKIPVMPTYHPSYLLRPSAQQGEAKKQAWDDLQAVMKELGLPPKRA
ncbi:Uracil-DNA glycosylase, family 4 [Labilithrix luteola]|uniref:Type-4 uracil-DNA glycosylase n=2 Tax=Labilithrix luteola TaxID=1391654 RepID=A0A0K1QDI0_9BACT|nr:Uracil-DNA glycosylase, family 4 [Labilithrix luteola]